MQDGRPSLKYYFQFHDAINIYIKRHLYSIVCNTNKTLFHNTIHHAPCTPTKPAPCTKGQPIKSDLTAPLLTLANYLYTYIIRLLPHIALCTNRPPAPLPFVSLSPIRLVCPGVNPNSHPNPLLRHSESFPNLDESQTFASRRI